MIAAIGAFDGFHRGHQTLLKRACQRAGQYGDSWGIVTFRKHPGYLVDAGDFRSLFTAEEQATLERVFEIPLVCRIDFTPEVAGMKPADFLDDIASSFCVRGVVVGEDFRFGAGRAGDAVFLTAEGARRGWPVDIMPLYETSGGLPVCSTAVRAAVSSGDMATAWEMLSYPFFCQSRVVHGNGRGRKLGFPTANVEVSGDKVELPEGVYATLVHDGKDWHVGAANVGFNPTFSDVRSLRFEVNLLDYGGDLYDRRIAVFLVERIRGEVRFDDVDALIAQIATDSRRVAEIGERALREHPRLWETFGATIGNKGGDVL